MSRYYIDTNIGWNHTPKFTRSHCTQPPNEKYGYDPLLNKYRNLIDNITADNWKKVRWYINKYDFQVKDPIINRAFYKYWEIVNEFDIFEDYCIDSDTILHIAEAPGGFIQGTNIYLQMESRTEAKRPVEKECEVDEDGFQVVRSKSKRSKSKREYIVYSISLNKDLPQYKIYNLPTYNRSIINKYICITYGKDNTGDINNFENVLHIQNMAKKRFYFITADGGFDEGVDFNNKEQLHYQLIFSEIKAALQLQDLGGHYVLKMFDIFTETSIHLLYLLRLCYKEVWIYKPKTSRPTNSEKYVICKNFILDEVTRERYIASLECKLPKKGGLLSFALFNEIPEAFVENVKTINKSMVDRQCTFLKQAIDLCTNTEFFEQYESKVQELVEHRRQTFYEWEETYNLNAFV